MWLVPCVNPPLVGCTLSTLSRLQVYVNLCTNLGLLYQIYILLYVYIIIYWENQALTIIMGRVAYIDGRNLQQSYSNGVNSNYHCSDRNFFALFKLF